MSKRVALGRLRDISRQRSLRETPPVGTHSDEPRAEAAISEWPIAR
jgi:hypothetical protein